MPSFRNACYAVSLYHCKRYTFEDRVTSPHYGLRQDSIRSLHNCSSFLLVLPFVCLSVRTLQAGRMHRGINRCVHQASVIVRQFQITIEGIDEGKALSDKA
jgi:hypothetical protein